MLKREEEEEELVASPTQGTGRFGVLGSIWELPDGPTTYKPFLQVADLRLVTAKKSAAAALRLLLPNGVHSQQSMLDAAGEDRLQRRRRENRKTRGRPPPDGCGRRQAQRVRAGGGGEIRACGRPAASEDAAAEP